MEMDYKQTVFLPKTEFPMRGGLPKKEPEIWSAGKSWVYMTSFAKHEKMRRNSFYMTARLMLTVSCISVMR